MSAARQIRHVILTRFNLRSAGREAKYRATAGWMDERFDLFEKFTVPSINAQTDQDFLWFVFFDAETEPEHRERLAAIDCPALRPQFVKGLTASHRSELLRAELRESDTHVLTTRLDNDDGLSRDHVARLQSAAAKSPSPGFINFDSGYSYHDGKLYLDRHRSNAFCSYLEPVAGVLKTVSCVPHTDIADAAPVIHISDGPAWLQVIHGGNVSNQIRGRLGPADRGGNWAPSVAATFRDPGSAETLIDNYVRASVRTAKTATKEMLKQVFRIRAVR